MGSWLAIERLTCLLVNDFQKIFKDETFLTDENKEKTKIYDDTIEDAANIKSVKLQKFAKELQINANHYLRLTENNRISNSQNKTKICSRAKSLLLLIDAEMDSLISSSGIFL